MRLVWKQQIVDKAPFTNQERRIFEPQHRSADEVCVRLLG
jgi:hypothetical protein